MGKIMRFIKQKNSYSCVPVAFLNIMKWLGVRTTYKENYHLWKMAVNTDKDGSAFKYWFPALNALPHIKVNEIKVTDISNYLSKNIIILLCSAWYYGLDIQKHMLLVVKEKDDKFFCVNTCNGHEWLAKSIFAEYYLQSIRSFPRVYSLEKL